MSSEILPRLECVESERSAGFGFCVIRTITSECDELQSSSRKKRMVWVSKWNREFELSLPVSGFCQLDLLKPAMMVGVRNENDRMRGSKKLMYSTRRRGDKRYLLC